MSPRVTVPGKGSTNIGSSIDELNMVPPLARALTKALDDARGRAKIAAHVASNGKFSSVGDAEGLEIVELTQNPHRVDVKISATFPCSDPPIAKRVVAAVKATVKAAAKAKPAAKPAKAKPKKRKGK
jgi:hypothetical protein